MNNFFARLFNNSGFEKYFSNTLWLMIEKVLRMASGVLVGVWIARYLGPQDFGTFSYIMAIYLIVSAFSRLGLDPIAVREMVNRPREIERILSDVHTLRLLSSIIVLSVSVILYSSLGGKSSLYFMLVSISYIFLSFDVVSYFYEANVKSKVISLVKIFQLSLSILVKVILIVKELDLIWFFYAFVFDALILSVLYVLSYFCLEKKVITLSGVSGSTLYLLNQSWPLILTGASLILFSQTDKVILKLVLGEEAVGIYTAGARFSEAVGMFPAIIATSLFPAILNAKKSSIEAYHSRLQAFYFMMTWLGISSFVILNICSGFLVGFFGEEYRLSVSILCIHSLSLIFVFQWTARGRWLLSENLHKKILGYMTLGVIINILLTLVMVQYYGVDGAAIATVITQFLITLVLPMFKLDIRMSVFMLLRSFYSWKYIG